MKLILFFAFLTVRQTLGIIYRLNSTEYQRLPPVFHLDPYEECISQEDALYCTVDFELISEEPSELLTIIKEYSKRTYTHFNHSILHHGVCVSKTCEKFLNETALDLNSTLERCYNESLWIKYKLKTKIHKIVSCNDRDNILNIDAGDVVVAIVILTLLILNIVGSLYEIYCWRNNIKRGNRYVLCFSVFRNWTKLVAPSGEGPEERLRRLKFFNGVKTITTVLVILGHSPMAFVIAVQNPQFIEDGYYFLPFHFVYNGQLIVQSFFLMSGFLLAYNIQLLVEKKQFNWIMYPLGIILRWLRLTPPYALVLAFTSTWLRHLGSGPLWQTAVGVEIDDCRRDWWMNLLYVNNYFDNTQCMAQTWYLAADMQLFCVGLFICFVLKNNYRKVILAVLVVIGLVIPGVQIYLQNLNPILVVSPEVARNLFIKDPTFNHIYKRSHNNTTCYMLGIVTAYCVYQLQKNNFDINLYKKYRLAFYALVPFTVFLILLGSVFFIDEFVPSTILRVSYFSSTKLLYGLIGIAFIVGIVFKYEKVYRGSLEWRGWTATGRISYCAYLLHVLFIRTFSGLMVTLIHASFYEMFVQYLGISVLTFAAALPLWMLVESPVGQFVKAVMSPSLESKTNITKTEDGQKSNEHVSRV